MKNNNTDEKSITFRHAVSIYMASVLGGGILVLPGLAAQEAGSLSILAWIIMSVVSYPFAFTFSRLALRNPRSGGIYTFTSEAYGPYVSNGVGWLFLTWVALGAPAISLAAASYLSFALPMTELEIFGFALFLMLAVAVINFLGIRFSALVQMLIIVAIVGILVLSIASSLFRISPVNFAIASGNNAFYSVGSSMALIIWAYFGYENVPNLAGEFVDPVRDLRRSVTFSVVIIGVLYVALSIVIVGTRAYIAGGSIAPFSVILSSLFGRFGRISAAVIAVVAIFSTMNAYYAGVSKLIQTLAGNGGIPKLFSRSSHRTGAASMSILLLFSLGLIGLLLYGILHISYTTAFLAVSGAGVLTYIAGSASGIKLLSISGWGKLLPWISLIVSIVILFFIGYVIVVSIAAFCLSLLYTRHFHSKKRTAFIPIP